VQVVLEHEGRKWLEACATIDPDGREARIDKLFLINKYIVCVIFADKEERATFIEWIDENLVAYTAASPVNNQLTIMTIHFDEDRDFVKMKLYLSQFEPFRTNGLSHRDF
jgi:hypothetical protein